MTDNERPISEGTSTWVHKVVVALDGSEPSLQGLQQATDLSRRVGATLTIAHVRHVPPAAYMATGAQGVGSVMSALDDEEALTRQAAEKILSGAGVPWEFVVLTGSAGEQVVDLVRQQDADLVVVGSNKHGSLHNLVLGSTSAYIASHSPAAVLVVRPRVPNDRVEPAGERPATVIQLRGAPQGEPQS